MKEKLKRLIPTKRKIMQLYFALLFNVNFRGFVSGSIYKGESKKFCAPGINCYSCPGAIGACPLGSLQGSFSAGHSTVFYVFGILLLYGLLFGRMICGWLCPFGLVQELLHKIKTPKLKKSPVTRLLSYLKYVILVFFVFIVPIMYAFRDTPLPGFCKYICPAGTLEGGIGLLSNAVNESYLSMLGPLFTWKFLLMVSILVGSIFIFRLFCRFICPLGALYGLFNKLSIFGIKVEKSKCTDCGLCMSHCKVDIKHVGDQECISCGECVDVCPTKAISWKGSTVFLKANEAIAPKDENKRKTYKLVTRIISAVLLLAVLIGAAIYYWKDTEPAPAPAPAPTTPAPTGTTPEGEDPQEPLPELGNQVGNLCYSYDLPTVDQNGLTGSTINPAKTGKVTVLNFWGTWCGPCVAELPHFNEVAEEYSDKVTIIAAHSLLETSPSASDFIAEHYPDSKIIFAWDNAGGDGFNGDYYLMFGFRDAYPMTVVLDENGVITDIFVSKVTKDQLITAIEKALNQ